MSFIDIVTGIVIFWVIGINANFDILISIIASVILITFLFFQPIDEGIKYYQRRKEKSLHA